MQKVFINASVIERNRINFTIGFSNPLNLRCDQAKRREEIVTAIVSFLGLFQMLLAVFSLEASYLLKHANVKSLQ